MTKRTLLTAAAATLTLSAASADAATSQRVMFDSQGDRLVGDLYLPDDYQPGDTLPAIVVTGAWTTVKEQMSGRYAAEMADRGYAALAFDFRGWGQSEGAPRQLEDPERKTQDIVAAAAFMATLPQVDAARMGGLGICASAGYMTDASVRSPHIRSLALVAPWLHDAGIVDVVYGGAEAVQSLIETGREAIGETSMIEAASTTNESALMYQVPYYTEADRGAIPEYVNQFNLA
ncbi:MAG: CocE/NonD family hydrolase, partial [Litorimonas sp.]